MNRPKYVMRRIVIDRKSIKEFVVNEEERRQIKLGKVASLRVLLERGEHFDSPLVCNWRDDKSKWIVIDGNHRIEAIREAITKDADFQVEVWVAEYKNLSTKDEKSIRIIEREIYTTWNSGTPESSVDYLQQHFKIIPSGNLMLKILPVSIYGSEKLMPILRLVGGYINAKKQKRFNGSYGNGGKKAVEDFQKIEMEDIKIIRAFYLDMAQIFGEYTKGNIWYKPKPMNVFMRIWYDNKQIPRNYLLKVFKQVFLDRAIDWENNLRSNGRDSTNLFYDMAIVTLNSKSDKYKFLKDKDILETKAISTDVETDFEDEE